MRGGYVGPAASAGTHLDQLVNDKLICHLMKMAGLLKHIQLMHGEMALIVLDVVQCSSCIKHNTRV